MMPMYRVSDATGKREDFPALSDDDALTEAELILCDWNEANRSETSFLHGLLARSHDPVEWVVIGDVNVIVAAMGPPCIHPTAGRVGHKWTTVDIDESGIGILVERCIRCGLVHRSSDDYVDPTTGAAGLWWERYEETEEA